jgi:hypothetical protein
MTLYVKNFSRLALLVFAFVFPMDAFTQRPVQTVRGRILDEDSQSPLPGANVRILESADLSGTSSAADGTFRIENVPVGRLSLLVTFVGYEDRVLSNILVTSGKETVLEIRLKESLTMMDAIVVTSGRDKSEINNEMALTSARAFTVEETKRFAGSFNDPARMVSAYAGVDSDPSGNNFIIVRGNSPKGIQWRLEGIDIPNPNHFSDEGATGGPINALNSAMLANAEFYTGAFAPEFGNALSGVFDMKLRKGNNEKREYSVSVGVLGTDATAEGPFAREGRGSYLINYRYSTLSLLSSIGIVDFNGIPKYQDLSFKINLPTRSAGTFSMFGVGGKSSIREELFDDGNDEELLKWGNYSANMGVVGITQTWPLNEKAYLQNSVSVSRNGSGYLGYEPLAGPFTKVDDFHLSKKSVKGASTLNHKVNARHTLQAGLIYTRHAFDFYYLYHHRQSGEFRKDQDRSGSADHYQGFASWKYRPWQTVSFVTGFHLQRSSMNSALSLEPRASMRWQFHPVQAVTAGFGIHGKMEPLTNYYSAVFDGAGNGTMPNQALDFTKARHYVIGYENKLGENLFFKAETYYQDLFNVPVENAPGSSYSLINQAEGFTDRVLVNKGTGWNAGVELTLERFFENHYYFLLTASRFESRYRALDGVERNTMFAGKFVGNFLAGKEFMLNGKPGKNKVLGVSAKISSLGPRRFTPINLEASIERGRTVFFEDRAFELKGDNVIVANLAITYRVDRRRTSQELKLDVQNASNNAAVLGYYFSDVTNKIETFKQLPLLPVLIYTFSF